MNKKVLRVQQIQMRTDAMAFEAAMIFVPSEFGIDANDATEHFKR